MEVALGKFVSGHRDRQVLASAISGHNPDKPEGIDIDTISGVKVHGAVLGSSPAITGQPLTCLNNAW